jgi:uncharacterized protein YdeI (YjbR/CyaY-like superfamily)
MEEIPPDLCDMLAANPDAAKRWDDLTPLGRRDFLGWVGSARRPETRARRIESIPSRLASGKRRPCCYAVVPLDLHTALNDDPRAKANWKGLKADQKRNFADWVGSAQGKAERGARSAKAAALIAAGQKEPA